MQHYPAATRFAADLGGLQGQFLFSFAHHFDPENLGFGALRVFNDYILAPRTALPLHPHVEVEIVTIVLAGTLTFADAADNMREVHAGQVLRTTAGTGTQHAESNRAQAPAHSLELWFQFGPKALQPSLEHKTLDFQHRANEWVPLVSGRGDGGAAAVFLNGDATVWWANLRPGATLHYTPDDNRQLLLYAVTGEVTVQGRPVAPGDHLRLTPATAVQLSSAGFSAVLLIDMEAD